MRRIRSLQKILGSQLLVNASNIHPTVAFIQPVHAAVIQKSSALCLQRHNFTATASACFAAGSAQSSQSRPKRTQHSRRRGARKATTVPTSEPPTSAPPTKSVDTPSLDRNVRPFAFNDQCQIWNETQHRIRASSIPQYAFNVLIKLKLAGDHFQMHWSGMHRQSYHTSASIILCVGHDVFVVGGTVRDLLLDQVPKDVDLTTSASLVQVSTAVAHYM